MIDLKSNETIEIVEGMDDPASDASANVRQIWWATNECEVEETRNIIHKIIKFVKECTALNCTQLYSTLLYQSQNFNYLIAGQLDDTIFPGSRGKSAIT